MSIADMPDGFYLVGAGTPDVCLVKLYKLRDEDGGQRGVGFGIWDGGGFIPLDELTADTVLTPVWVATPLPPLGKSYDF